MDVYGGCISIVELVVAENCFHVLRVELTERTRVKIVKHYEVLTLVQLANQTTRQKILLHTAAGKGGQRTPSHQEP